VEAHDLEQAVRLAHLAGTNPGGDVMGYEITDDPESTRTFDERSAVDRLPRLTLFSRDELTRRGIFHRTSAVRGQQLAMDEPHTVIIHISVDQKRRILAGFDVDDVWFDLATGSFRIEPWPHIVFHPLVTPDRVVTREAPTRAEYDQLRARSRVGDHMEPETTRR